MPRSRHWPCGISAEQCHLAAFNIEESCDDGELTVLDQPRQYRRGLFEELRLDFGVGLCRPSQIGACLVNRGAYVAVERADLPGHRLAIDRGLDRAAIAMRQ